MIRNVPTSAAPLSINRSDDWGFPNACVPEPTVPVAGGWRVFVRLLQWARAPRRKRLANLQTFSQTASAFPDAA